MPHHTAPQYQFTAQEFERMKQRIRQLLQLKKEVQQRVTTAREMGDLSENGAYKYGKFELGNIKRELRRLHHLVEHGTVIAQKDHYDAIELGATFTLKNERGTQTYTLVNEHESDPNQKKLSHLSPLGKAVLGKKRAKQFCFLPRGAKWSIPLNR